MLELSVIRDTVMNVAEAITAALEIETEIINEHLEIIGGTGRYRYKIGTYEEGGDINSGAIYGKLLKSGKTYICLDPENDPEYDPQEGELAEICCPIQLEDRIIGLIGLVAFNEEQRKKIMDNSETLTLFLERMSELIASKLSETEQRNQLQGIVESMHEGLIALDKNGRIMSCNFECEKLLGVKRNHMVGKLLSDVWDIRDAEKVISTGVPIKDKEVLYQGKKDREQRYLCTIIPLQLRKGDHEETPALGAMILFQSSSDVKERIYKMTVHDKQTTFADIIGESQAMIQVKRRTLQIASSDSTVMITGESGTGKELFARAIHSESPRRDSPFIAINCGAIPEMLLESELFGYEKGAFTGADSRGKPGKFEIAHKGTLFLDEIGDLPLHLQVKLLHAIQNRQIERVGGISPIDIDVRIISATNKNLEQMITAREFREDLFFRLNVIPLNIPPLRERDGDVELLLNFSLRKFNELLGKRITSFDPSALQALLQYVWPGNVRELENVVEYAVNMETGNQIRLENLPDKIVKRHMESRTNRSGLKEKMDDYQRMLIEECLDKTGRSTEGKIMAARLLGVSESTLYRRIRELGVR
ncbi:sigma 54-interacting transcriptional regulator [Sinanaerobacter chloroacetimidivorans]|uniref:Sigma 54-interacting transcriptional regulator n=1 Tax=Sinanaerobacter chloroacetimidivorans TaxID=2818044 RepID=A0A8J7W1N3_9FIRM|nr:sigma 54-interacting transcriptional regulator [Sinanaerobacter chloroacetimidivorans]MBR0598759.1 sigma 54-interacting transcriptional regulator [Sinanaerobacter chloroacetimidivorans]